MVNKVIMGEVKLPPLFEEKEVFLNLYLEGKMTGDHHPSKNDADISRDKCRHGSCISIKRNEEGNFIIKVIKEF